MRLGRPFIDGAADAALLLQQLTDITGTRGRDFYQQVFVVEIHPDDVFIHLYRQWGEKIQQGKKEEFIPDLSLAVAAPVLIASGGNPKMAQGRYGVPAFPYFDHNQLNTVDRAHSFLKSRLDKTFNGEQYMSVLAPIAEKLAKAIAEAPESKGIVLLCDLRDNSSAFSCSDPVDDNNMISIGTCYGGEGRLWADLEWILDKLWWAKLEEGAEYGHSSDAVCSLCHAPGEVVSLYSKAWPWYSITWTAPISSEVDKHALHEEVALCQHCYAALSYGVKLFTDLSSYLPSQILQEAFKGNVQSKSKSTPPRVMGAAFVLPVLDSLMEDEEFAELFALRMQKMRERKQESGADRHLEQVVGFDALLPEEFAQDAYRLTLVYYTLKNADVQLWAVIEDVLPSAMTILHDEILQDLNIYRQQLGVPYVFRIPTLLARAYGSGYLWQTLTKVMHLESPGRSRFIQRVAQDLQSAAKAAVHTTTSVNPENFWMLQDIAKFYLIFSRFLYVLDTMGDSYVSKGGRFVRTWQELQEMANGDPENMHFDGNVEDLGYVMGHLVKRFSQQFYSTTKKEYLSSRVMTFGTDLTPDVAGFKALGKIEELSLKLNIHLPQQFRQRVAATLSEFIRQIDAVRKERDAFMAAFWAGYALYDLGRPTKSSSSEAATL